MSATTPRSWVTRMSAGARLVAQRRGIARGSAPGSSRRAPSSARRRAAARVAGQRHRDHHALAHAAGELVRVGRPPLAGARDADALHQLDRALVARAPWRRCSCAWICSTIWSPIRMTGFSDAIGSWKIIAISAPRIGCSCSSEALDQLGALVRRGALEARVRRARQTEQRHRGHRLAAARLADDREDLAGRGRTRRRRRPARALLGREGDLEVVDGQQRLAASASREPDPRVERGVDDVDDGGHERR